MTTIRAGDALTASAGRLPMAEFDGAVGVVGADGPVPFLDLSQGRDAPADPRRASLRTRRASVPAMEQRISLVTLGVADLPRARAFYQALGWQGQEVEETVFFQAGGLALVLWDRHKLAEDCGVDDTGGVGFGGIALAHNVRSDEEVDELLGTAERAGGRVTKPAALSPLGFYSGAFVDPDGHPWEVAHNPGFRLAEDGALTLPDFGQR